MKNLYTVTITTAGTRPAPLNVLAPTETAAVRKAIKALFGGLSAAPETIDYHAELKASAVIC